MKMVLLGGLLLILPAVAVVLFFWGSALMMIPALASLFVAALPFVGFAVLLRGSAHIGDDGDEH